MRQELEKIITTDKRARQEAQDTETHRLNLEAEIFEMKERMRKECMERAEKEVNAVLSDKRKKAEAQWLSDSVKYKKIEERLKDAYTQNRSQWAREISKRVIDGEDDTKDVK